MEAAQICSLMRERFGTAIGGAFPEDKHPRIHVAVEHWRPIAEFLRHDRTLSMDWLSSLCGIDYTADEQMCVVYDLWSFNLRHRFAIKVYASRPAAIFPSVIDLWPGADWHERETFDLLGIQFQGHPDLRRILLADDWEGHPLKKDYVFPREYQGIPASVELDWQQQK